MSNLERHPPEMLLGAQLDLPGGARIDLELDDGFERGILLEPTVRLNPRR